MRLNPCELEIDLFCRGVRIDRGCDLERDSRGLFRTRAGLGSGLELVLKANPRDVWVNVPVTERFVQTTPYLLRNTGGYQLVDDLSGETYDVRVPSAPAWYGAETASGRPMHTVGVLQGTYLAVYVGVSCVFWHTSPKLNCRFCTTGLNVDPSMRKSVADVVDTAFAAKEESGITFVHLNTGYQGGNAARLLAPFVEALKERVGVLVGVQIAPEAPLDEFDRLIDLGADHFSFCFEYYDPGVFRRLCPGKHEMLGQEAFFRTLEHCQGRLPRGACSGEIIAGNEPVESTLAAIDYITGLGAFPTVCVFRPLAGSDMEETPPPRYEEILRVMRHVWKSCRDHGVPIGLAPNIDVSLVVQPTDTAHLAENTLHDRWYRAKLAVMRQLARGHFRRQMSLR